MNEENANQQASDSVDNKPEVKNEKSIKADKTEKNEKHEHKRHHEEHHEHKEAQHEHKKSKSGVNWFAITTIILGILLILSLVTNGFMFGSDAKLNYCTNSLSKMKNNVPALAADADSAISSLTAIKTALAQKPDVSVDPGTTEKVKLEFYVMSQCPYGTQVEDAIAPVLKKLGNNVDFKIDFIANENNGQFTSLHGVNEVNGDIVQLCAIKYNPDKYMDMIICQNENAKEIPNNWKTCAQDNGLNVDAIQACYDGSEGKTLLSQSIKNSNAVQATGSPTIYLGGKPYKGSRAESDFLRAICNEFKVKPEACSSIPEPVAVNMIVISDTRCAECEAAKTGLTDQLTSIFPGLKVTVYDYSQAKAKEIMQQGSIKYLPAFLFDDTVKNGEGYANVQSYLVPAGSYTSLNIGAGFDPTAEICDNSKDDDGNSLVDCNDPGCTASMVCRPEMASNVQVFIMSDCPYGKEAVKALKEVKDNFGTGLSFGIHYIASDNGDGTFSSLHGEYEAKEDIVQLCAKEKSPEKWFDYVYCRSLEGIKGKDWKTCAASSGIDTTAVETCANGEEGKSLLREDIKIAESLGISASPTWLANNKYQFSGIDAETVKQNVCKYNKALSGCENVLSSDSAVPAGNCG